jgi:N-acetylglucosaminyldiphosphoundecaprenol N-acetyl-beta-D-mannosaminyltransferase
MAIDRLNVLGVGVSAINLETARDKVSAWIDAGGREYVCVTDVHAVIESRRDRATRRIHNAAGLVAPDGMPLVWLLKLAGHPDAGRVCGYDLMAAIFAHSEARGFRHYLYGSSDATLARLSVNLKARFPQASVAGTFAPPFRDLTVEEDEIIIRRINNSGADIVWVGLGAPKQERWMAAHRARLSANVLIGVGAAFDLHAGLLRRAPVVMQRCGMEWLYRLAREPRRLWRRYLKNNPLFLWYLMTQMTGLHTYELEGCVGEP